MRFRRGPIDFVSEQHAREERPLVKPELPATGLPIFLENIGPDDIGRHEIRCKLDAVKIQLQCTGQGPDHECFGQPWNANDQAMAARKQRDEHFVQDCFLADDDFVELFENDISAPAQLGEGIWFSGVGWHKLMGDSVHHEVDAELGGRVRLVGQRQRVFATGPARFEIERTVDDAQIAVERNAFQVGRV